MNRPLVKFEQNLARSRNLGGIRKAVLLVVTAAIDTSDILRAQHVLAVSALDHFIHEMVRIGMMQIFSGQRAQSEGFLKFRLRMSSITASSSKDELMIYFQNEIRLQHSFLSFQQPDKIADAIRLITDKPIWRCVSNRLKLGELEIKSKLRLIVDRRNKIAHESDADPSYPGEMWPITESDVDDSTDFIESICKAIYAELEF